METVGVIITTFKRDIKMLSDALDSVLTQTYPINEIIIVDDNGKGSSFEDDIVDLCSKYEKIIYLQNEMNSGAQVSRNRGIMASKSKYLAFLDDDDIWLPQKIEKQIELMLKTGAGMAYCNGYRFYNDDFSQISDLRNVPPSLKNKEATLEVEMFEDIIGTTSQAIVRKDCFFDVGLFDVDMPAVQDYEMWLRISRKYKVVCSEEYLLMYREHTGDRTSTNWRKCFEGYTLILKKHKQDFDKNKYCKAKFLIITCKSAFKARYYIKAVRFIIKSFFVNPLCILHFIERACRKKTFQEFYTEERLCKLGIIK